MIVFFFHRTSPCIVQRLRARGGRRSCLARRAWARRLTKKRSQSSAAPSNFVGAVGAAGSGAAAAAGGAAASEAGAVAAVEAAGSGAAPAEAGAAAAEAGGVPPRPGNSPNAASCKEQIDIHIYLGFP